MAQVRRYYLLPKINAELSLADSAPPPPNYVISTAVPTELASDTNLASHIGMSWSKHILNR